MLTPACHAFFVSFAILLLLPLASPLPDFCTGSTTPDNGGGIGTPTTCTSVPAIDPLNIADAGTFATGTVDSSGDVTFPVSVCELNPQGYSCATFDTSTCTCSSFTAGTAGTGRGPIDVALDLVDSSGATISTGSCPFTTTIATSCTAGCATSSLTIPGSTDFANCGFQSSTSAGVTTLQGYVRLTVTEYFLDTDGVTVDTRLNVKIATYSITYPSTLTISDSGVTVVDPHVKAEVTSTQLNVYTGTGLPTATVLVEVTVQNPLVLSTTPTITTSSGSYTTSLGSVDSSGCSNPSGPCTDIYTITITGPSGCTMNAETYTMTISYSCQSGSGPACPIQSPTSATVVFSFQSTSFCPTPTAITVTTSPTTLITYADNTLTTTENSFFTGATVYAAATNFVAASGSNNPAISSISLPATATWTVGASSASSSVTGVSACTTTSCGFSTAIPTTSLTQPAIDSSEVASLSVTFTISFANGGKRAVTNTYLPTSTSVSGTVTVKAVNSTSQSSSAPKTTIGLAILLVLAAIAVV